MSWNIFNKDKRNKSEVVIIQTAGNVQSFPASLFVPVTVWNRVIRDYLNEWNNTTFTFTAKEAGVYLVCAKVILVPSTQQDQRSLQLYKNDVPTVFLDFKTADGLITSFTSVNGVASIRLAANDNLRCYMYVGSSTGVVSQNDPQYNQITITQLNS